MKHRTIFCQFKTQLLPKTVKYRYGYYQYPFARKRGRKNYHNFLSEKGGGATTGAQIALVNVFAVLRLSIKNDVRFGIFTVLKNERWC